MCTTEALTHTHTHTHTQNCSELHPPSSQDFCRENARSWLTYFHPLSSSPLCPSPTTPSGSSPLCPSPTTPSVSSPLCPSPITHFCLLSPLSFSNHSLLPPLPSVLPQPLPLAPLPPITPHGGNLCRGPQPSSKHNKQTISTTRHQLHLCCQHI